MRILSLPMGADTGGVTASIARAFDTVADPEWEFRAIISTLNFIDYQRDMAWSVENVKAMWQWADVIHLHHNTVAVERLTGGWKGFRLPHRSYVVEYHGTGFREEPRQHLAQLRRHRALGIVSTLDLYLLASNEVEWIPCPVNVEVMSARKAGTQLAAVRGATTQGYEQDQRSQDRQLQEPKEAQAVIRIAHAPTNRAIKSTEHVIAAVDRLRSEGHDVELDLIEGVNWDTCLERKAKADIYFDQVILGYGNNAIECWGMGIPVIAGAAPATLAEMERRFGELPFYNATEATIYDAIKALVLDPELRAEYAAKGLAHVRRFHDEAVVVEQLKAIYQRAVQGRKSEAA